MRRIIKRNLVRDLFGRAVTGQTERLTDRGDGRIHVLTEQTATFCSGCRRPVTNTDELRGRCDYCRVRGICSSCEQNGRCQACSKRLCGGCRRGFVGSTTTMTVCPPCWVRLTRRQVIQDRIQRQQMALQHWAMRQQVRARAEALRIQAARARMAAHLQQARLRQSRSLAMMREVNRLQLFIARIAQRGRRYLR